MMSGYLDFLREPAPILVLGLGNTLLRDDGVGPALVGQLSDSAQRWEGQVEFVDGGTQGLALLGRLTRRKAVIILDALSTGAPPGTVHRFSLSQLRDVVPVRGNSAHEGNAGELLAAAQLLDELPSHLFIVGVEPQNISTGVGLSDPVRNALPAASDQINLLLTDLCNCDVVFRRCSGSEQHPLLSCS